MATVSNDGPRVDAAVLVVCVVCVCVCADSRLCSNQQDDLADISLLILLLCQSRSPPYLAEHR